MTPRPVRMPIAARQLHRQLRSAALDLLDFQDAIVAPAAYLPRDISSELYRLHLSVGELVLRIDQTRESLEHIARDPATCPVDRPQPTKRKRVRPPIAAALADERRELLQAALSRTGETQAAWCARWCLREDDVSRWQTMKGGVRPGQGPDNVIRACIKRDLAAMAPTDPTGEVGQTDLIQ